MTWLDEIMNERLQNKASSIEKELRSAKHDFNEIFYRKLARSFGFNKNSDPFEQMAMSLPFHILARHRTSRFQLESLLYGQSGMLNRTFRDEYPYHMKQEYLHLKGKYGLNPINIRHWKFLRMRPTNFPTIRISQFAQLIEKSSGLLNGIFSSNRMSDVVSFFRLRASAYWNDHYVFDKTSDYSPKQIGRSSIDIILINTVIPFLVLYGIQTNEPTHKVKAIEWLESIKAEQNAITAKFRKLGVEPMNAAHSQALIHLKTKYCDQKQCLNCKIGQTLLK